MSDNNENKEFFNEEYEKNASSFQRNNSYNSDMPDIVKTQAEKGYKEIENNKNSQVKSTGKSRSLTALLLAIIMIFTFLLGFGCGRIMTDSNSDMYDEIMKLIEQNYLFEYNDELVQFNAATGAVSGLDRYTRVLDPYSYYELLHATDPELFGVGYAYDSANKNWIVTSVVLDGPADYAISESGEIGLRAGDILVSINGTSVNDISTADGIKALLNTNEATISINRNGNIINFRPIEKRLIKQRYVEYFYVDDNNKIQTNMKYYFTYDGEVYSNMYDTASIATEEMLNNSDIYPHYEAYNLDNVDFNNVGYLKLHEFSFTEEEMTNQHTSDFDNAMNAFRDAYNGKGKLILDLNSNPGGYNVYCEQVASYFIYNGTPNERLQVYSMVDKNNNTIYSGTKASKYADYFDENATEKQFVILTNNGSASASEMLTGAILAYETGIQVGMQTYGKGISQTVKPVKNVEIEYDGKKVQSAYALYYTFAYFYSPKVEGSNSPYNYYCNQSDKNGDGVLSGDEVPMGYKPDESNSFAELSAQLARAKEILK